MDAAYISEILDDIIDKYELDLRLAAIVNVELKLKLVLQALMEAKK